ncbi:hypothetical protein [Aeribacillus pallidus]|jgi:hypothetical protein
MSKRIQKKVMLYSTLLQQLGMLKEEDVKDLMNKWGMSSNK